MLLSVPTTDTWPNEYILLGLRECFQKEPESCAF